MKSLLQLNKNLKRDTSDLKPVKIGILGDSSTQLLAQAIAGVAVDYGFTANIFEADFNQIDRQVLDPSSDLYAFNPEVIIIYKSSHKLLGKYNKQDDKQNINLASEEISSIKNIYDTIVSRTSAKIIFYNYAEINDAVFGNYANKLEFSFLFQLRKLNYELMAFAQQASDFYIFDLSSIQNSIGKKNIFQSSIYINTEMILALDALPEIAYRTFDIVNSLKGKFKKCLILDLDNTTWGGVIGDDGIENIQVGQLGIGKAFTEFQYWVKKLKNRGIIIAVCSKNTESIAKEPFEKHPDMVLRLDDIAVFMANWETKVDNISQIQRILNIGFDSMVFLDDNPFERNIVRENIPGLTVPELPEDPAEYLEYLYSLNLFETVSFSSTDTERTKQYQTEAKRLAVQKTFANENEFLKSLNMLSVVQEFNNFNTPRVAQLSQRSNQFNLRTIRYTENDIKNIIDSDKYHTFTFTLVDKFGDNGMICVVILKTDENDTLFIDNWFMSCRVLKRGMENFTLNTIVKYAKSNGFVSLKGEYIATAKNELVKEHYKNLGFKKEGNYWMLDVNNYKEKECFITIK